MKLRLVTVFLLGSVAIAFGQVQVNLNFGPAPYYGYPQREIVYVERYVPDYDVPRVMLFSRHARVAPMVVVDLYRRGYGWDYMCDHYRVPRNVIYGSAYGRSYGPPYGRAKGFYKNEWKHRDRDWREHGRGRGRDRD